MHFRISRGFRIGRTALAFVSLCAALILAGCKDQENDERTAPIRGNERLAWNQMASSLEQLRSLTFNLYVDEAASTLSDVTCENASVSGAYTCSGLLPRMNPGRRELILSAVLNGIEGPRSAPLTVIVSGTAQLEIVGGTQGSVSNNEVHPCSSDQRCDDDGTQAAADGSTIRAAAWTSDGRVFIGDDSGRLRVSTGDHSVWSEALRLTSGSQIVGLALDSRFESTRAVYVAATELSRSGQPVVNVTRYRESGGILGEGAVIVAGLPFAEQSLAPLAVDDEGLVYIALPASSPSRDDRGTILRLTRDGLVPQANRQPNPVIAYSYARPTALVVESASGRIWLAGTSADQPGLATVSLAQPENGVWPLAMTAVPLSDPLAHRDVIALSLARNSLLIASVDAVARTTFTRDGTLAPLHNLRVPDHQPVMAANQSPEGEVRIVVQPRAGVAPAVVELDDR